MTKAARYAGCGVVLALSVLAGCGEKERVGASTLGSVHVDTANNATMDGVSDQQLKAQAQALTPEQAVAAGMMVDTTIHMENLGDSDTASASRRAAATDTAAKAAPPSAP
jgi:hypothetical protein